MSEYLQVRKTNSPLRNVLIQVITAVDSPPQLVAAAADLIALDVRFNDWFLRSAKPRSSHERIDELLESDEAVTASVAAAFGARDASGWEPVHRAVEAGLARLRNQMSVGP